MLDLSDEALSAWAANDERIPDLTVEDVPLNDGVTAALGRLTTLLNRRAQEAPGDLVETLRDSTALPELGVTLSDAGAWHALRVLMWLVDELPGGVLAATDLVDRRGANPVGGILAEAERSLLLGRLYAPERLRSLEEACKSAAALSEGA